MSHVARRFVGVFIHEPLRVCISTRRGLSFYIAEFIIFHRATSGRVIAAVLPRQQGKFLGWFQRWEEISKNS
jgi:hypothetical protein